MYTKEGGVFMSEENVKRIQITLKPEIAEQLDLMAEEWGTTRSGMVTILTKLRREYELDRNQISNEITKSVV